VGGTLSLCRDIAILAAAGLAVGCSGTNLEEDCSQASEEESYLTIGTGSVFYEEIETGGDLGVENGPQGGFHVFGALRAGGLHPGTWEDFSDPYNPIVSFSVTTDEGHMGGFDSLPRPLKVRSDGTLELVGEYVVLEVGTMDDAVYRSATVEVVVTDACGTEMSDSVEVFLVPSS
jgi:hypothetical protein